MPTEIHAMGEYWHTDRPERTTLGELVHRAKDLGCDDAARELVRRVEQYLIGMRLDRSAVLTVMPPSPDRPSPLLQRLVADLVPPPGVEVRELVVRHHATPRIRELEPAARPAMVASAGYETVGDCRGRHVVVVDDVVLTGTTLRHVAGLLLDAGADAVTPVALARSRRR